MGLPDGGEVEMFRNACPSRLAEAAQKRRIFQQTLDCLPQGVRIAGWHEDARLPVNHEFRHPADVRGDDGQARSHRFENRERKPFGPGRENEDVGAAEQLRDVNPLPEKADGRLDAKAAYFFLYGRSLRTFAHQEGFEVPSAHRRQRANKRERVLGRLQAPDHHEARPRGRRSGGIGVDRIDAVADNNRRPFIAGARRQSRPALILGDTNRHRRQRTKSPLRPAIRGGGQPPLGQEGPPVHGVDANGYSREPRRDTAERRGLCAIDMHDVRPFAPQELRELHQAEDVAPRADGTAHVREREKTRAGRSRSVPQRAVSMSRYDHVEIAGEGRKQRSDICLCAPGLGQRYQERESRAPGKGLSA